MRFREIHSAPDLMNLINEIGFLPLLNLDVPGWSADDVADEDCGYILLPDGGYEWPLWEWKGGIIQEMGCAYGKFFDRKAAFISKDWWPDFCNYRRSLQPFPAEDSIEFAILETLKGGGSMITRDLRKACGFTGPKMRGKFDSFITTLQMSGYIVTEDFVYPKDKNGKEYGWGWSLLTTPETFLGSDACHIDCSPNESYNRLLNHFHEILPDVSEKVIKRLLR